MTLRAELQAFFERYREAFDRLDGDAVAALWHVPSGISDGRSVTWWADATPMRQNMHALCAAYREAGYGHAEFELDEAVPLGAMHAFARLRWTLRRADGQLLQAFGTGYQLRRLGDGWRVLMVVAYEEALADMKPQPSGDPARPRP